MDLVSSPFSHIFSILCFTYDLNVVVCRPDPLHPSEWKLLTDPSWAAVQDLALTVASLSHPMAGRGMVQRSSPLASTQDWLKDLTISVLLMGLAEAPVTTDLHFSPSLCPIPLPSSLSRCSSRGHSPKNLWVSGLFSREINSVQLSQTSFPFALNHCNSRFLRF